MTSKRKSDARNDDSESENEQNHSEKSSPLVKRVKKDTVAKKKSEKKDKAGAKGSNNAKTISSNSKSIDKLEVDLGKKKRVIVDVFKGQPLINIREFYEVNGEERPGKKGIALTIEQWAELRENIEVINNHVKKLTKT